MIASVSIPVTVSPEAAELITRRGYQAQFEQMVAKVCEFIPQVTRIEARLCHAEDGAFDDGVDLLAFRHDVPPLSDPAEEAWSQWRRDNFPPEVWITFQLMVLSEVNHARWRVSPTRP
jgi:hypothetical protein